MLSHTRPLVVLGGASPRLPARCSCLFPVWPLALPLGASTRAIEWLRHADLRAGSRGHCTLGTRVPTPCLPMGLKCWDRFHVVGGKPKHEGNYGASDRNGNGGGDVTQEMSETVRTEAVTEIVLEKRQKR